MAHAPGRPRLHERLDCAVLGHRDGQAQRLEAGLRHPARDLRNSKVRARQRRAPRVPAVIRCSHAALSCAAGPRAVPPIRATSSLSSWGSSAAPLHRLCLAALHMHKHMDQAPTAIPSRAHTRSPAQRTRSNTAVRRRRWMHRRATAQALRPGAGPASAAAPAGARHGAPRVCVRGGDHVEAAGQPGEGAGHVGLHGRLRARHLVLLRQRLRQVGAGLLVPLRACAGSQRGPVRSARGQPLEGCRAVPGTTFGGTKPTGKPPPICTAGSGVLAGACTHRASMLAFLFQRCCFTQSSKPRLDASFAGGACSRGRAW